MTSRTGRIARIATTFVAAATMGALAAAAPASAAGADCPDDFYCLWTNYRYTGTIAKFKWNQNQGMPITFRGRSINDRASSMINNTDHAVRLIGNLACKGEIEGGWERWVPSEHQVYTFAGSDWNDRVSCVDIVL